MIHLGSKTRMAFLSSALICSALFGYWFWFSALIIATDDAYIEAEFHPVNSRMMGFVREVFVQENDSVTKGEKLLKLDDVDTLIELNFKKAKLKKAQADFGRAERLREEKAISASDFELVQAAMTGITAEVEGAELKLKFTEIIAPYDGVIAKQSAQSGQFVQPGQSLFVIVPNDHNWIKANFKETEVRLIHPGQVVNFTADAFPDVAWVGKVESIYPSSIASTSLIPPENATGNFTHYVPRFAVRISFTQKETA
ncbi:MAG: HlyD family secretion protein, partial [Bdellovibrionaceae bacterium]|nr:HlyD family secretion protein [Pseudobdellovibrionaceae bacterium]